MVFLACSARICTMENLVIIRGLNVFSRHSSLNSGVCSNRHVGFSVTAPHLWNNMPGNLHLIDSVELFKSKF